MINDLGLNASIVLEEQDVFSEASTFNKKSFKTKVYYFQMIGEDYTFNYEGLNEEQLITYSMIIVYLMLKNGQYVSTSELSVFLPDFRRRLMMVLMEKLRGIFSTDIILNEINSYNFR